MESSRSSKRRRIIQSYISPPRPDLPATFESLSDDPLTTVLEFVGDKSYKSFGGVNKRCKEVYLTTKGMTKETFLFGYASLSRVSDRVERSDMENDLKLRVAVGKGVVRYNRKDVMDWALEERNEYLLKGICEVAGEEGRIDLLVEVLDNVEDDEENKGYIFESVDYSAALCDKLKVLKWLESKELFFNTRSCAQSACDGGHIHILQWLREERGLNLDRGLYIAAIHDGGHLHVMKWLREQACPWSDWNFTNAARKGNLEVLQWLHDEGCPWPDEFRCRVSVHEIESEVTDWCRTNGYIDRIRW